MFSNGTEAMIWIERNCHRCKKYDIESADDTECELANALDIVFLIGVNDEVVELGKKYNCTGDPTTTCSEIDIDE